MSNLARNLAELLNERGWTQSQLADLAGVEPATVSRVMKGTAPLISDSLVKMATALGTSPARLLADPKSPTKTADIGRRRLPIWDSRQAAVFVYASPTREPIKSANTAEKQAYLLTDKNYSSSAFALLLSDRSMSPTYPVGMVAIIEPEKSPYPNCIVAVGYKEGDSAAVSLRLFHDRGPDGAGGRAFEAPPVNPAFRTLSSEDLSVRILGVMVERRYYEDDRSEN